MISRDPDLNVDLRVNVEGRIVTAHVTITNAGKGQRLFYRYNLSDKGRPTKALFEVTANGRELQYTGMSVKREAPTLADFLSMKPGESIADTIPISMIYDFPPGPALCTIRYDVINPSPLSDELTELSSNTVEFRIE